MRWSAIPFCLIATLAAAEPLEIKDLFRPVEYRTYRLSPNGVFMVETVPTYPPPMPGKRDLNDPKYRELLAMPEEEILLTDLRTNKFQRISHSRRGFKTSALYWIDDHNFVWNVEDTFGKDENKVYAERVTIRDLPEGDFEVLTAERLRKEGFVLAPVPGAQKVLFMDWAEDGLRLHRIDPRQEVEKQLVAENLALGGVHDLEEVALDASGTVRAFEAYRGRDQLRIYYRDSATDPWRAIHSFKVDAESRADLESFDPATGMVLVVTNEGHDRAVLRELDPRSGKLGRIRHEDPTFDLLGTSRDPLSRRLFGVLIDDAAVRLVPTDPEVRALHARVKARLPNSEPTLLSVDATLAHAIVFSNAPDDPGRYRLYDAKLDKALFIARAAPWLEKKTLARSREVTFKARDGLRIHAYYTAPLAPHANGKPLVLMPHGGPLWVRERLMFDPEVQFLASRGYGVLQVDFRGSGGYGRDFLKRGFRQWGREMQDDLQDALGYALAQGWADADRVCIFGASYGGYSAMMGVIKHPESYRCGVTHAGVSDLGLLFKQEETRDDPALRELIGLVVGDPEKEREVLNRHSPAFLAKDIKRPVFIVHGGKDTRAEPEHAYRLRAAIEGAGGKPEWAFYPEAGHGVSKLEDQEDFYGKLADFLGRHIGDAR